MNLEARWLEHDPAITGVMPLVDIFIDTTAYPTRYHEYKFALEVAKQFPTGVAVDLGAGFDPKIHILPWALEKSGWYVLALDHDPKSLAMPKTEKTVRMLADIRLPWQQFDIDADLVTCISTLEHFDSMSEQLCIVEAARRILRPGGVFVATADFMSPDRLNKLLQLGGFTVGRVADQSAPAHLVPRVSAAAGRKEG